MIGSRIGLAFAASTSGITAAILIGAQIRSAAMHALSPPRLVRIKAVCRPLGIYGLFAAGGKHRVVVGPIPVRGQLLHIAGHIKQHESDGWECGCQTCPYVPR